ncbi:glucosyltransferase domain-containing protein [Pantoea sp. LMR881]|uniref:glucosyltransferase domain-containing protein n=1 Tax=Pantoea sp. LMR881 TaxID=3014336 RepID=UPI0022B07D11|nr:glucosyltransferase domain-containing protein [Pantoea sp. LMR881]MCZ4060765.1 glucosyltransferase domain-containing protein [Pantoea sp. LMR881]
MFKLNQYSFSNFKIAFILAILSYFFVYGFEITHFTLSIDEEPLDNFFQTLSAGRWGHALLRHYVLPEPYVPFFTTAFSLLVLSISAAFCATYLSLNKLQSAAFVIMLAAMPQFAYQLEFSNQADTVSLAFLCSVLSLFMLESFNLARYAIFIILTILCLSVYQSIFLFAATLLCVKLTIDSLQEKINFKDVFKRIIIFGALVLISLVINSFLSKWIASFYNVQISSYLSSMIGWGKRDIYSIFKSVLFFIRDCLAFKYAYGMNSFPFALLWLLGIILLAVKRKKTPCWCHLWR